MPACTLPSFGLFCLALLSIPSPAAAESESVQFPAAMEDGSTVALAARLTTPAALAGKPGPHPAVVLLHGCDGMDIESAWVERDFADWPYLFLEVDSFGPRGIAHACEGYREISPAMRARDAHAARAWLAAQPIVDRRRIAAMGWSMGGETALRAMSNPYINEPDRARPFAAVVAFYPYCPLKLRHPDAPLLLLIGGADDWTPPGSCRAMQLIGDDPPPYELVEYPGATHAFDWPEAPAEYFGHRLTYDSAAADDAYKRVRAFLDEHLR
jgi:dienelactone hydrolase